MVAHVSLEQIWKSLLRSPETHLKFESFGLLQILLIQAVEKLESFLSLCELGRLAYFVDQLENLVADDLKPLICILAHFLIAAILQ